MTLQLPIGGIYIFTLPTLRTEYISTLNAFRLLFQLLRIPTQIPKASIHPRSTLNQNLEIGTSVRSTHPRKSLHCPNASNYNYNLNLNLNLNKYYTAGVRHLNPIDPRRNCWKSASSRRTAALPKPRAVHDNILHTTYHIPLSSDTPTSKPCKKNG